MPDKAQADGFWKVPDFQIAGFNKKLLEMYGETPPLAERYMQMIEMIKLGVSPDTAAPAVGIFDEWEEIEWFRDAVETAWAQYKARVLVNVGKHLTGQDEKGPNATLASLFLKAHCGFNEKSAEGWHQNIKILPVVSASAGIHHSPDRDYWEFYQERQEQAEREAEAASGSAQAVGPVSEPDEFEPG